MAAKRKAKGKKSNGAKSNGKRTLNRVLLRTTLPEETFAGAPPGTQDVYETMLYLAVLFITQHPERVRYFGWFWFRNDGLLSALERRGLDRGKSWLDLRRSWLERKGLIQYQVDAAARQAAARRGEDIWIGLSEAAAKPEYFSHALVHEAGRRALELCSVMLKSQPPKAYVEPIHHAMGWLDRCTPDAVKDAGVRTVTGAVEDIPHGAQMVPADGPSPVPDGCPGSHPDGAHDSGTWVPIGDMNGTVEPKEQAPTGLAEGNGQLNDAYEYPSAVDEESELLDESLSDDQLADEQL